MVFSLSRDERPVVLALLEAKQRSRLFHCTRSDGATRYSFVASFEHALHKVRREKPDIFLLDQASIGADMSAILSSVAAKLRTRSLPIIVLSDHNSFNFPQSEKFPLEGVFLLDTPIDLLLLKIRAVLRRTRPARISTNHEIGNLLLDEGNYSVGVGGMSVYLHRPECMLLAAMIERPSYTWSREELLEHVWGAHSHISLRSVDRCIGRVRAALGQVGAQNMIVTVDNIGYKIVPG